MPCERSVGCDEAYSGAVTWAWACKRCLFSRLETKPEVNNRPLFLTFTAVASWICHRSKVKALSNIKATSGEQKRCYSEHLHGCSAGRLRSLQAMHTVLDSLQPQTWAAPDGVEFISRPKNLNTSLKETQISENLNRTKHFVLLIKTPAHFVHI